MICRLCLNNLNETNTIQLFKNEEENNKESYLIKLVARYLLLEITADDAVSTAMCRECSIHLDEIKRFCEYIEEKQRNLQNEFLAVKCIAEVHGGSGRNSWKEYTNDNNNLETLLDIKDVLQACDEDMRQSEQAEKEFAFAKENDDGDDDDEDDDDKPLVSKKSKSVINTAKYDTKVLLKKPEKSKNSIRIKRKLPTAKLKQSTRPQRSVKKSVKSSTQIIHSTQIVDGKNQIINDEMVTTTTTTEEIDNTKNSISRKYTANMSKDIDDLIAKNIILKCEICDELTKTFAQLKTHFRKAHKTSAYIHCCTKRFTTRFFLMDHINLHLNPAFFQCKICAKNLKSRFSLDMHIKNSHSTIDDLKFVCSECGKKFSTSHHLRLHGLAHQTERNFACEFCDKAFVSKVRLKLHIKAIHENVRPHVCDFCGQAFKFKPSFDQHVNEHQGIREPPAQCDICGEWFKHKMGLRKHIKRQHAASKLPRLPCNLCDRTYGSRDALQAHIRRTHQLGSDLQCHFCEKSFKVRSNLEEHIAIHTGEKHNKCQYCPKEFRSKANMYMHIKRSHSEEWAQAKIAKSKGVQNCSSESK